MREDVDTGCTLCDLPTDSADITDADGNAFCCRGCLDVHETLSDVDSVDADDVRERVDRTDGPTDSVEGETDADRDRTDALPDGYERTFLEVRGMYCATCEAFIESLALETEGVRSVSVSYVTETVRVDHDPERISVEELCEVISGLGYTAFPREDAYSQRQANHMETVRVAVVVVEPAEVRRIADGNVLQHYCHPDEHPDRYPDCPHVVRLPLSVGILAGKRGVSEPRNSFT